MTNSVSTIFSKALLSVLTKPIGSSQAGYSGHQAVNRSLFQGLKSLPIAWNVDPDFDNLGTIVMIPGNLSALYQAIDFKQAGKIKKLIIGPNMMENAYDFNRVATHPAIDLCLVPSTWVKTSFETDEPTLKGRVEVWFAGVDTSYWQPLISKEQSKKVLVYFKTGPVEFCQQVERILIEYGWQPQRLTYRFHTQELYKSLLSQSRFAVFISKSETQGIALAEAWAMDVPTVVWNPGEDYNHGRFYKDISSCPYLGNRTGIDWKNFEQFKNILNDIEQILANCSARNWALANISDSFSVQYLWGIIQ